MRTPQQTNFSLSTSKSLSLITTSSSLPHLLHLKSYVIFLPLFEYLIVLLNKSLNQVAYIPVFFFTYFFRHL